MSIRRTYIIYSLFSILCDNLWYFKMFYELSLISFTTRASL
nr:MAG TPA: hypothetical protein [Crassvirales sp.]